MELNYLIKLSILIISAFVIDGYNLPKCEGQYSNCKCGHNQILAFVECYSHDMAGITRDLELINKNYVLHSVKIINTRDTTIPEHFFGNTTLKFVEFSMPKLKSIPNKLFEEQRNSVKGVSVINSSLSEIPIEMLSVANVLKTIQISESKLFKVVRSNVFKPLKAKLSSLVLSYNSISTIEPGAFNGLDNLQLLNISGNDLKIISADSFPVQLPRLFIEIFSKNHLKTVPSVLLNLTHVHGILLLQDNDISTISSKDLETIGKKSQRIFLEGNPLICSCDLRKSLNALHKIQSYIPTGKCKFPSKFKDWDLKKVAAADLSDC